MFDLVDISVRLKKIFYLFVRTLYYKSLQKNVRVREKKCVI